MGEGPKENLVSSWDNVRYAKAGRSPVYEWQSVISNRAESIRSTAGIAPEVISKEREYILEKIIPVDVLEPS